MPFYALPFLFCFFRIQSQAISVTTLADTGLVSMTYNQDVGFQNFNCFKKELNNFYHPKVGLINFNAGGDYTKDGIIYQQIKNLDVKNCIVTTLFDMPIPKGSAVHTSNYSDYKGRIYMVGNFNTNNDLIRLGGIYDPSYELLLEHGSNSVSAYDVTALGNEYYVLNILSNVVPIYDENFVFKRNIMLDAQIRSFATVSYSCDSIITYGFGTERRFYEPTDYDPNTNYRSDSLIAYRINMQTGQCERIKDHFFTGAKQYGGIWASSPYEFRASDPNCDFMLDLDYDNSSGLFPYDFTRTGIICGDTSMNITDEDLYLHSLEELDSVILQIQGIRDIGRETLINGGTQDLLWTQRDDSTYVLTPKVNTNTVNLVSAALKSIKYVHAQTNASPGQRIINLIGYNRVKASPQARFIVDIKADAYAGRDTTIFTCGDFMASNMTTLVSGIGGGEWQPNTVYYNSYDSKLDFAKKYYYIIRNECSADTATLQFKNQEKQALFGSDTSICDTDFLTLEPRITIPGTFVWDDGFAGRSRTISGTGRYIGKFTTVEGCEIIDTIYLAKAYIGGGVREMTTCNTDTIIINGEVYPARGFFGVEIEVENACDTFIYVRLTIGGTIEKNTTVPICFGESYLAADGKNYIAGDVYTELKPKETAQGCDTLINYEIVALPEIEPEVSGDTIICFGARTDLSVTLGDSFEWNTGQTTQTITVGAGSYTVKVLDEMVCAGSAIILVTERPQWFIDLEDTIETEDDLSYDVILTGDYDRISDVSITPYLGLITQMNGRLTINPENQGLYKLTFRDDIGCLVEQEMYIAHREKKALIFPNVLRKESSQNGLWTAGLEPNQKFISLSIFDRWGNQIYINKLSPTWDGMAFGNNETMSGVYVFVLDLEDGDGNIVRKSGDILVVD